MSDKKFTPPIISYKEFRLYEILSLEAIAEMMAVHKLSGKEYVSQLDYDIQKDKNKIKMISILQNNIKGGAITECPFEEEQLNEYGEIENCYVSCIKLSDFIAFADSKGLAYPPEIVVNNSTLSIQPERYTTEAVPVKQEVEHDDIISDETILKLKELPLPKLKQQVVMLATERNKWDASMMAAANIGILFYEGGLSKPATLEVFISEYKKQLDKLPDLPDTAIKKIYKYLPDGYRYSKSGGRATKDDSQSVDINPIIKAAVYAGSLYDTEDVKKLSKLKAELAENEYEIPPDDVLQKIIAAVKNV